MSPEQSLLPPSPWPTASSWTVLQSRDEFGGDLPLLSLSAEHGVRAREGGQGRAASEDVSGYRVVRPGDLVVNRLSARDGGFGVSSLLGLVSPAYWVFRTSPALVDARWLDYILRSAPYRAELRRISKFMPPAQFDLPWDQLRRLPLPLPPVDHQRRIADFLDAETRRIDALVTLGEQQAALMAEKRASLVFATVTEGLNGTAQMTTVDDAWFRFMPENWSLVAFRHLALRSNAGEVIDKSWWGDGDELLFSCSRDPVASDFLTFLRKSGQARTTYCSPGTQHPTSTCPSRVPSTAM